MIKEPESMDECIYFTNRTTRDGSVKCWVFKEKCLKCGNGLMSKPVEKGKVKIRAKEYLCPECKYTVPAKEYEESLTANIKYKCPYCRYEGETQIPFKRKKVQIHDEEEQKKKKIDALKFQCAKCGKDIYITKKLREV
ncbi:MAG: hypothetical protein AB1571_02425 [Nanoarchaeota archaeon]